MDDLLREFLVETAENLVRIDSELVKFERQPDDPVLLKEIFRLVHTVKGACGFVGLPRLERVAHAGESVLGKFRDGVLPITPSAVTLIFKLIDHIRDIIRELETNGAEPEGDDGLLKSIDDLARGQPLPAAATGAQDALAIAEPIAAAKSIRVGVDVLENLMTTVGELVLTRNQLMQVLRRQKDADDFAVPLQRLNHITSELQDGIMKTRMQPIGNVWSKLPRLVRDLALELNKKIDLQIGGEETGIDRHVLELIKDPLTHMVRNAADHGIETPVERLKAGKPETGTIRLSAWHEGGHVLLEIVDDGRGLSIEKIKEKALQNKLAGASGLPGMSDQQIMQFIFRPGFSTASGITAISGRGVGMDVVRTNIEKIGGSIEIFSMAGKGSRFRIKIPLTLAIVPALIVVGAREQFAIPQIGIAELVRASSAGENRIELIKETPVLRLRDSLLPLVSLKKLLQLGEDDSAETKDAFVVVAKTGTGDFGIIVDAILDAEDIVVKPLPRLFRNIPLFSGNTILGDGRVIMILDLNGIAAAAGAAPAEKDSLQANSGRTIRQDNRQSFLLFRSGTGAPKAVPLALIARLEEIDGNGIEFANGTPVVQYRGKLMPLMALDEGKTINVKKHQPVLVFTDNRRSMGLIVDEIVDIVENHFQIDVSARRPGYLGTSIIAGKATDIVDAACILARALGEPYGRESQNADCGHAHHSVLLVDDSLFFRNLLTPMLVEAGYAVTAVDNPSAALQLEESGKIFDVIVSDIEMPGMNGLDFAAAVRRSGPWRKVPLVALSAYATPQDLDRGFAAGFDEYVAKFNRDALLATLQKSLNRPAVSA